MKLKRFITAVLGATMMMACTMTAMADYVEVEAEYTVKSSSDIATQQETPLVDETIAGETVKIWNFSKADDLVFTEINRDQLVKCSVSLVPLFRTEDGSYRTFLGDVSYAEIPLGDPIPGAAFSLYQEVEKHLTLFGEKNPDDCLYLIQVNYLTTDVDGTKYAEPYLRFVDPVNPSEPTMAANADNQVAE